MTPPRRQLLAHKTRPFCQLLLETSRELVRLHARVSFGCSHFLALVWPDVHPQVEEEVVHLAPSDGVSAA